MVRESAVTKVVPALGVTVNPVLSLSKLRYFVPFARSMALATLSEAGELLEVGTMVSPLLSTFTLTPEATDRIV